MAKDGEVVGAVVLSVAALILVHDHIKRPVQAVFDAPMGTGGLSETGSRQGSADEIICVLSRDFPAFFPVSE